MTRCSWARWADPISAGLFNNFNDGMAWGLFPLFFAAAQLELGQIGTLAALYPATWGLAQIVTGAPGREDDCAWTSCSARVGYLCA